MNIKNLTQADFDNVLEVAKPQLSAAFNIPRNSYMGAAAYSDEGEMLGFICLMFERTGLYSIPSLATKKGHHGKGIMRALFNYLFKHLPGTYWLEVHPDNKKALGLYESVGFVFTQGTGVYKDGKKCLLGERRYHEE